MLYLKRPKIYFWENEKRTSRRKCLRTKE